MTSGYGNNTFYVLSNVTIEGPFLINTVKRLCKVEICTTAGYDTWIGDLLRANFDSFDPKAVFLILDGNALLDDEQLTDATAVKDRLASCLDAINVFVQTHPEIPLFVSSIDIRQRAIMPLNGKRFEIFAMNTWREGLSALQIPVLEIAELATNMGRERFYDDRTWYMGKIPFSMSGQKAIAEEIHRVWRALIGNQKKCIALDLDGTLWDGIIGEDGIEGIKLSDEDGGSPFRDFQRRLLDIKGMGAILAIVSKNNLEDALNGLEHPAMILHEQDFVAVKANWRPKIENLQELAEELNIGLNSIVFIDNNEIERESARIALPQVIVPDFPDEPEGLPAFAAQIAKAYFPKIGVTNEDRIRTRQYRDEAVRIEVKTAFSNYDDYLASLEMHMTIEPLTNINVPRVAQLTQKTNQFNLTTRRYTEGDLLKRINSSEWRLLTGRVSDKFGDFGLSLFCMIRLDGEIAEIDTFLMSCRVMGRGCEYAFLAQIEKALERDGIRIVKGTFIPSGKNSPAKNLLSEIGYELVDQTKSGILAFSRVAPFVSPDSLVAIKWGEPT